MKKSFMFTICTLAMASAGAETVRQHDAHVHGAGELNIAVDETQLLIEFTSPGVNIVGFEHAPSTDEQHAAVSRATEILDQPSQVFELPQKAGCVAKHIHVASMVADEHDDHHQDEHKDDHDDEHHSDEHDDHHDDDKHAHDGSHEEEHEQGEVHSEFHAEYEFNCENIADLSQIKVNVFDLFPATETLQANVLTPSKQTSVSLDKAGSVVEL